MADSQANPNAAFQTGTDQAAINAVYSPGATQTAVTGQAPTAPVAPPPQTNVTVNTSPAAPTMSQTAPTATQTTTQVPATMPQNGSVVDLLNSQGQDSSYAARQQLAQQYGIQGYTGTAAQNTDLAKKYTDAFNAKKGTTVPQTGAAASSALDSHFQQNAPGETPQDLTKAFMDSFASMNPIEANIYQQLSKVFSSTQTQQSLSDVFNQAGQAFDKQTGVTSPDLKLADINKIMSGTEDDIRNEITMAGGSATASQVAAMTGARNKTLLTQASYLTDVLNARNDYIDHVVSLTQADRAQASKDLDQKLGIANTLVTMSENMQNAAKDNLNNVVQSQGYEGLYTALKGNPAGISQAEQMLGLGSGGLKALANYTKPLTAQETLQNQNLSLQNQKLKKEINTPTASDLQFVPATANQPAGVFNKTTGAFTPTNATNSDNTMQMALAQSNIQQVSGLLANSALSGVVGPNEFARNEFFNAFNGNSSNFIAGVQQLTNQLTLTNLENAKTNGATFGALSDPELSLLQQSATKLNTWAIKDGNGNVTGYKTDEKSFKQELDKINNFAKLDYVLKGGNPGDVDIITMPDGSLQTKNSDGSITILK